MYVYVYIYILEDLKFYFDDTKNGIQIEIKYQLFYCFFRFLHTAYRFLCCKRFPFLLTPAKKDGNSLTGFQ